MPGDLPVNQTGTGLLKIKKMEIWKDIENYEGLYKVSNTGKVCAYDRITGCRSGGKQLRRGRILKLNDNGMGYKSVELRKNKKKKRVYIHILVAKHFIPLTEITKTEINHKDGIKQNNHAENLEWCNRSENMVHYFNNFYKRVI